MYKSLYLAHVTWSWEDVGSNPTIAANNIEMENSILKIDALIGMSMLSDESINLIVTSPPYNKSFFSNGKHKNKGNSIWKRHEIDYNEYEDNMPLEKYEEWMVNILNECGRVLAKDGSIFFNHKPIRYNNKIYHPLSFILKASNVEIYQEIIWNRKNSPNIRNDIFLPTTERIYWLKKKGCKPKFNRNALSSEFISEVWNIPFKKEPFHPAPFPEKLVENCILSCTDKGDLVLDPFIGSGTTAIVAKQHERRFLGFDIDEAYVSLAKSRL